MGRHTTKLGEGSRAETRPPLPYPVHDGRVPPSRQAAMDRRAQRRKSRLAAVSAASMLAVGGAAGMSMAMADEPESSGGSEIVFSGDCGLLTPTSNPSSSQVTVTEGSQVRYTNDLGTDAELHVGTETYDIGEGSTQVFVMNQSAEIAMVPDCHGLFSQYESAQVNVTDAPQSEEQDASGDQDDSEPSTAELPSRGSDGTGSSDADAGTGVADGDASGSDGASRSGEEPAAGEVSEEPADEATDEAAGSDEEEVNSFGPPGGGEDGSGDTEFDPAAEEVVAVDPKAVADGANGLLALVAIVCLVGVSAAVMRTILRQRATA